jgi:methylglutaconyl-CoA hydratase
LVLDVADGEIDADMIADTSQRIAETRGSDEGREGLTAFLEKRKPAWIK